MSISIEKAIEADDIPWELDIPVFNPEDYLKINFQNRHISYLHYAAQLNAIGTFIYLVSEKGYTLDHLTSDGLTPLHLATRFANLEIIEYILKSYNQDQLNDFFTKELNREVVQQNLLLFAAQAGNLMTFHIFNKYGFDYKLLVDKEQLVERMYEALIRYDSLDCLEYLIDNIGLNTSKNENQDKSQESEAKAQAEPSPKKEIAKTIQLPVRYKTNVLIKGKTLLMYAIILLKSPKMIEKLVTLCNADAVEESNGKNAFFYACDAKNYEAAKILANSSMNYEKIDVGELIQYLCKLRDPNITRIVLDKAFKGLSEKDIVQKINQSKLDMLVGDFKTEEITDMLQVFIEYGFDVNQSDLISKFSYGFWPNWEVCQFLIQNGAKHDFCPDLDKFVSNPRDNLNYIYFYSQLGTDDTEN